MIWPKAWADVTALTPHELLVAEWAKGLEGLVGEPLRRSHDERWVEAERQELEREAGERIRQGLDHCRANLAWPPSIAEFLAACRQGATAEQRAFASRAAREAAERRPALTHGTWGDAAENVRAHVQRAQQARSERPDRTLVNIARGVWTREMEDNFRYHAGLLATVNHGLGRLLKPIEWPDGKVA